MGHSWGHTFWYILSRHHQDKDIPLYLYLDLPVQGCQMLPKKMAPFGSCCLSIFINIYIYIIYAIYYSLYIYVHTWFRIQGISNTMVCFFVSLLLGDQGSYSLSALQLLVTNLHVTQVGTNLRNWSFGFFLGISNRGPWSTWNGNGLGTSICVFLGCFFRHRRIGFGGENGIVFWCSTWYHSSGFCLYYHHGMDPTAATICREKSPLFGMERFSNTTGAWIRSWGEQVRC